MNCSVCQSINGDDANFCRACGAAIASTPAPTGQILPPPRPAPDPLWAPTVPTTSPDPQWAASPPAPMLDEPGPEAFQDDDDDVAPTLAVPVAPAVDVRRTVVAELAARRRRERALLLVGAIVVVAALGVVAAFALGRDAESTASTDPLNGSQLTVVTTVAPIGPTTVAAVTLAPTTVATPASPTTVALVVALPSTVTPTVTSVPTAPTVVTTVTTAATVPSTAAPTTTPTTFASPVNTAAPTTTTAPSAGAGDLGLSTPISRPACDGQYITLIGASVDTPGVAGRVDGLLDEYPGSKYLKTELVCSSLSPRSADGKALYVVFFGPFASASDACSARSKGTKDSYVKVLANTAEPSGAEKC